MIFDIEINFKYIMIDKEVKNTKIKRVSAKVKICLQFDAT